MITTVGEAMREYLTHLEQDGERTPASIQVASHRLDALLDRAMPLAELTPARAQALYGTLTESTLTPVVCRDCLMVARSFGRYLAARHWVVESPFTHVLPMLPWAKNRSRSRRAQRSP